MKLLEIFRNHSNKFFAKNTICRTVKDGFVYVDNKKVWVPAETRLTIEYFDIYSNRVFALIDGRQQVELTYEYLMDCVLPINVDTNQVMSGVQILQRTNNILSNETLVKIVCLVMLFSIGILLGKVF